MSTPASSEVEHLSRQIAAALAEQERMQSAIESASLRRDLTLSLLRPGDARRALRLWPWLAAVASLLASLGALFVVYVEWLGAFDASGPALFLGVTAICGWALACAPGAGGASRVWLRRLALGLALTAAVLAMLVGVALRMRMIVFD